MSIKIPINKTHWKADACRRSLFRFLQEFWEEVIHEEPVWNWHIEYVCNELQMACERLADGEPREKDIVINLPPGESKSTICTIMLPVWQWLHQPTCRVMTASYSNTLSQDHSMKSRDIIRSDKFQRYFPHLAIRKDMDNKTRYQNTQGGERFATSIGGTVTGFHAHLIIVDDPQNPKKANSEAERENAIRFMDSTLSTRKVDKAVTLTIVVMQRLHENDVTGHLLKRDVEHICLPAELSPDVKPSHLREKYIDGLMDIQRMPKHVLNDLKINLGSYGYASQMQQTPSPLEGGIWQKWIQPIDEIPQLNQLATDWDLAYTKNDRNSASAYVTAGVNNNKMYIVDIGFDYLEFPQLIAFMKDKTAPHFVEKKASGISSIQTLTQGGIPAIGVNVDGGDKIARTSMATPYAEAGMIFCKREILDMLYNDHRQGILKFPNTGTDLNDALTQSITRLLKKPVMRARRSSVF